MEPPQEQDFYRRLHSSTRTLAPRVTISTTSNLQRPPLPPRTPLQMSPPMSRPNPWFCRYRTMVEEEGGDDFVEIDDMLLDELDLGELDLSWLLRRLNLL
ncbi:hypothetical protein V8E54_000504 [Elaphomyces granulatus]